MIRFVPRPHDIYVASYPRSGTSLTQMLLLQLSGRAEAEFRHIEDLMPFLDRALKRGESMEEFPSPRITKTHLSCRVVTRWPGKFIYVVRDGKDVLVSYFHLVLKYVNPSLTFDRFFDDFMSGRVQYGSWFRHVSEWMAFPETDRLLVLRYEDLVRNPDSEIDRLTSFLGWSVTPDQRGIARDRCQFTCMRTLEGKFEPISSPVPSDGQTGRFFRQGRTGGAEPC